MGGYRGERGEREGQLFGARVAGFKSKMSKGEDEEECSGDTLGQVVVVGTQVEGVRLFERHGELREMEQQGGLMWGDEMQGDQTNELDRDMGGIERREEFGDHSLKIRKGPTSALVAAVLEWSDNDKDE
ncbi:hypothetical protein NDU88_001547 [Pleurodeles waltl]|uniref:Uncharacterized protein n=1 Tax=Pleurodeles waltl TaxID=8319 RepID=A0AAV7NCX1_PLEWA|nr:hypothetical protein NDU88_001547 [Pleurodeles waltl]